MKERSSIALIIVALFCTLCFISCGPSRNDAGAQLISIEVTPSNPVMVYGDTQQFKAIGHYADNSTKDLSALVIWELYVPSGTEWLSTNSISSAGVFCYRADVIIEVHAKGGVNWDIVGRAIVTPAVLQSMTISPADPTMAMGSILQLTATARYYYDTSYVGDYLYDFTRDVTSLVNWSSSEPTKVTVTSDYLTSGGLVSALAAGTTTTVEAMYTYNPSYTRNHAPFITGFTSITVGDSALVSIAITPVDPSVAAGSSLQFTATGTYADASTHDLSSSVTWTSSDPGKATINAAGLATGVAAGTTIISATSGTASNTTTLTVTGGGPSSTSIISTGTMTKGSGSATVNGIQFSDTLANITADDIVKNASFLQSGMMVKIKGSRNIGGLTGVADEIHVENDVRGAIFSKGLDFFLVLGQTVYVDGGTIFANVADFAALLVGDNVEVYGMRNAAGHIRATRVEKLGAAGVDEVRGTITAKFGSGSTTITIDTGSFNVDGATTILPSGAPFDVGTLVEIKLTGLHVDQLKVEDSFDIAFKPAEGEAFAVEGLVTGFTSTSSNFFVNGQAVNASGASFTGGVSADLANDVRVEAQGHFIGTVLVADKVVFK